MPDDRFGAIAIQPDPGALPPPEKPARPRPVRRARPARRAPGGQKNRRWPIALAIFLCLPLVYGIAGFFLGAPLLVGHLAAAIHRLAGVDTTVDEARFNPFTLRLRLHAITGAPTADDRQPEQEPVAQAPLFTIDRLAIDLNPLTLLGNRLSGSHLEIQGLALTLTRHPDGTTNLPGKTQGSREEGPITESPLFSLDNIRIGDSKILFDDQLTGKKHHVEQISLDLPRLSNSPVADREPLLRPSFSAIINGSPVELSGETTLPGPTGEGSGATNVVCNIRDLDLPTYFTYLPASLPFTLSRGTANGKLAVFFVPDDKKGSRLTIDFQLAATDIELANPDQTLTMNAPGLEISGDLHPLDGGLRLRDLHLKGPRFSAVPSRFSQDLAALWPQPGADQTAKPAIHLAIDTCILENGVLQLLSPRQEPSSPPWTSIHGTVKNFTTAAKEEQDQGSFLLSGKQEETGASLEWRGVFGDSGIAGGHLQLQAYPVGRLLEFVDPTQAADAAGVANLSGHFTLAPRAGNQALATLADAAAEIDGLILAEDKQTWLTAKTVKITGAGFRDDQVNLGALTLEKAELSLRQNRLPRLFARFADKGRPVRLDALHLFGSAALLQATDKSPPLQLTELRLHLDNPTSPASTRKNFDLTTRVHQSGTLKAEGLITFVPPRAQLSLDFSAISAEQIAPWLPDVPLFQQGRATIHGQGTFRWPEPSFTGTLELDAPLFRENDRAPGLTANQATLNTISVKAGPVRVGIEELFLDTPLFTWQLTPTSPEPGAAITTFLHALLTPAVGHGRQPTEKEAEDNHTAKALINTIRLDNGTVNLVDQRLDPPWSPVIHGLKGTINNLRDQSQPTTFDMTGLLDTAPFTLTGAGNLLDHGTIHTSRLELRDLPLAGLGSQITPLLDVEVKDATVSLSVNRVPEQENDPAETRLLLTAIRPGTPESVTALTLALLTDHRDQINLSLLPAEHRNQPLIRRAIATFNTLMVKAELTPFRLAGPEFADLDGHRQIRFTAGRSVLTESDDHQQTLRRFADLLAARPHLGLILTGMADPLHDRAAIQAELEEKEKKRVARINQQLQKEWQERQKRKTENQTTAPPPPIPGQIIEEDIPLQEPPPVLLAPEPVMVSDSKLHDLAQERLLATYDFCTTNLGIASKRITLQEKTVLSQGETGGQVLIGIRPLY